MQVVANGLGRLPAHGYNPLLGTLTEDSGKPFVAIHGGHGQGANLRHAQAATVHELEDRLVSLAEGNVRIGGFQKLLHFIDPKHIRQMPMLSGVGQKLGKIILAKILGH